MFLGSYIFILFILLLIKIFVKIFLGLFGVCYELREKCEVNYFILSVV